jgi:tripartite-type tricarboxylate transporter receptor subunit TctC
MLAGHPTAQAQGYPSKPVRIICTFAAGGTADVLSRGVARQLSEIWGQQVVVENRAGANTQIGAEHVAKSPPDGYTLMVTSEGTFVMNPSLYDKLPDDAARSRSTTAGNAGARSSAPRD